ncbi:alpha/beta hydrolase [Paraglaciecola sp.]|uniref:alpha/beta hydrolase n=1 Tax=Paraglaciecola sp. TaxID=1920173 RepID=UPI0032639699
MKKIYVALIALPFLALGISLVHDSAATWLRIINSSIAITRSYDVERDISYGIKPWQKLDIYKATNGDQNAPVIVFFFGGGWSWGDKVYFEFVADSFVRKGYTVVIPNYVLFPEGRFPEFVHDGASTIKWVADNIRQHGGDAEQIHLVGHSAGAYISVMLATDDQYLNQLGLTTDVIKGVGGVAGPYNFTPKEQEYIDIFGPENFDTMRIANHVNGNEPPMIMLYGAGDTTVGLFNLEIMAQGLKQFNIKHKTVLYDQAINHTNILLKLHPWFAGDVSVADDIDKYFKQNS